MSADDLDLREYGYAPGGYCFQCIDCPKSMDFMDMSMGDKRAWRCKAHAIARMEKERGNG